MLGTILTLAGSIILVFAAAFIFVNTIEWLGNRFHLSGSFVGAILAPLFTSLPELIVFLVAVFSATQASGQGIAIGTLFGQPFMASSLSYGLVGLAVISSYFLRKRLGNTLHIDKSLAIPYIFITILFPLTVIPGIVQGPVIRYVFGVLFLAAFLFYIWIMYRIKHAGKEEKEPELPYISRLLPEKSRWQLFGALAQLLIAVGLLYLGSEKMVGSVSDLSQSINISPLGLALILVPAATAVPETISALIWGFQGKDTLAMGALVGEKVLYSTFYPGLGLFVTNWVLDVHAYLSVIATSVISLVLLIFILRGSIRWYNLLWGIGFFIAYAVLVFVYKG